MRIAFYAPMKPPDSEVPSGDRETARLLLRMLGELGHDVALASRLVTWRAAPDPAGTAELAAASHVEAERVLAAHAAAPPDLWLTYHLYHKAPDWLGPRVAEALAIPYVVVEACRTARHAHGPWAAGHAAADVALARADAVAALHGEDEEGLRPVVEPRRLHRLPPAVDARVFAAPARPARPPVLLAVGMMRPGDKLASYRVLGEALSRLSDRDWTLVVAGDGPARDEALAALPADRTDWRGEVAGADMPALYAEADIFAWPSVNEAFGVALLEAQAAGLPAVAGRTGGVPDIVEDGVTGLLAGEGDAAGFARALARLLDDPARIAPMGLAAARRTAARHDLPVIRDRLGGILRSAVDMHAARAAAGAA